MSDSPASFHVTVAADVRITDTARLGGRSPEQLAELLSGLIQRHAWEAGLAIADPASVRVEATPIG